MADGSVRLMVKIVGGAPEAFRLGFGKAMVGLKTEPLFRNIPADRAGGFGIAGGGGWHLATVDTALGIAGDLNPWDLCHRAMTAGIGVAGTKVTFAEPDFEQRWFVGDRKETVARSLGLATAGDPPDKELPYDKDDYYWFRDREHSQLEAAREAVGKPSAADRVRIAHFDTGYDPNHATLPRHLDRRLEANFVEGNGKGSAVDVTDGVFTNLGHGTGTLGILAGNTFDGEDLGGAPNATIVPIRVANSVVLFRNSAIARAMDYVYGLCRDEKTRVHVITMSMGGLASQAWAEAINRLYDAGVFIVTAAGNNFANVPTRYLVYPSRFKRVVAACGAMADGRPYADLPPRKMAGNYGPGRLMDTAMAAYTPNAPWARIHQKEIVDFDGRGTSSATPQIAAAAALWIQKHKDRWDAYPQGWMKVEAVRAALFGSVEKADARHFGNGLLRAEKALSEQPKTRLKKQDEDDAFFALIRGLGGLSATQPSDSQKMLELEALQLTQRSETLEAILRKGEEEGVDEKANRKELLEAMLEEPDLSVPLRETLEKALGKDVRPGAAAEAAASPPSGIELRRIERAKRPKDRVPKTRRLRIFAFDPLLNTDLEKFAINQATITLPWEEIEPGPVDEYLEVVDIDPASNAAYQPVDLNDRALLAEDGLERLESDPQFHQLMTYAVARKTIRHFEQALGRVALWAPRRLRWTERDENGKDRTEHLNQYVQRLRVYPHALREANAYYSPDKKALLFGYCNAVEDVELAGENLPGGLVFTCLSYDIVAHETSHALLDGLHRRYIEATNPDMLAFHEAFSDIVALFQHFTHPEALRHQIAQTRGRLELPNELANLAKQFGHALGQRKSLRTAIDYVEVETEAGTASRIKRLDDVGEEPHDRGAVLVAAVFEAFIEIYKARSNDLIRIATQGTGQLPIGTLHPDLVDRLAREASKAAEHVLRMVIRALDYCPPVSITFGDFLRAMVTGDYDLEPIDPYGYRVALVSAFRRRRIYPEGVLSLSPDSLRWEHPEALVFNIEEGLQKLELGWKLKTNRRDAFDKSRRDAGILHNWLKEQFAKELPEDLRAENMDLLGFSLEDRTRDGSARISPFEVHSVRPARRIGKDGQELRDVIIEITQRSYARSRGSLRGGATWIVDGDTGEIRYCVRKRVDNPWRIEQEARFMQDKDGLAANYFSRPAARAEPFAVAHRGS